MAKWDLDAVDKLEEINRLQAQTIERQLGTIERQAEIIRQYQQAERTRQARSGE